MHTLRVFLSLAPFALSFLRDFHRWLWWGAPAERTPEDHQRRAKKLVDTIVTLGPTFVKMAQVFAARADIIPEPYLSELGRLVDQVPPMPFSDVARTIRESYGKDVDEIFDDFERVPVAAAS
ncbi:MAG TPA: AarF/UbiB family protein, partial [Gemmatimonadaceae bacterium]|nr:AarF/UbiB family protein [Gemmatimonadaceae bacterium]